MEKLVDFSAQVVQTALDTLLRDRSSGGNIIWATDPPDEIDATDRHEMTRRQLESADYGAVLPRMMKQTTRRQERTRKKGEVFTPAWICCMMNDFIDTQWFGRTKKLFAHVSDNGWTVNPDPIAFPKRQRWQNYVDSRRLEICCGEAPFLASRYDCAAGEIIPVGRRIGILDRKLRIVGENTQDESEWFKWALRAYEGTYGYEYQGDNLLIARVNLLLTFAEYCRDRWRHDPCSAWIKQIADVISWNIWQMDGLKSVIPYGKPIAESAQISFDDIMGLSTEPESVPCTIRDWRGSRRHVFSEIRKGSHPMKFDFVIGNPPYQEEVENNGRSNPVYNLFMDAAYEISECVELITPARFLFDAGQTPKAWNNKMLTDSHLKVLFYERDATKIFGKSVEIKGGVAITMHSQNKNYGCVGTFTAYPELNSIIKKVNANDSNLLKLDSIIASQGLFRFSTDFFHANPEASASIGTGTGNKIVSSQMEKLSDVFREEKGETMETIRLLGRIKSRRAYKYIKREFVMPNKMIDAYKLFIPEANNNGTYGETLTEPTVGYPLDGSADTFLNAGPFATIDEAHNLSCYMKTKFFRALLGVKKVTQHCPPAVWSTIPLQDFTPNSDIDWSQSIADIDLQLYRKYGLDEKEIEFIETHVKEMA